MLSALRCAPSFLLLYPNWKYSCGAVATVSLHAFLGRPCRNHTNPTVLSKQWVSFPQSFPRKVDQSGIFSMMVLRFVKDLRVGGPCSASLHFTSRPRREDRGLQCQQVEIQRATCVKPWLTKICYGSPWLSIGTPVATAGSSQDITKTLPGVEVSLKRCCVHGMSYKKADQDGKHQGKAWETVQFQCLSFCSLSSCVFCFDDFPGDFSGSKSGSQTYSLLAHVLQFAPMQTSETQWLHGIQTETLLSFWNDCNLSLRVKKMTVCCAPPEPVWCSFLVSAHPQSISLLVSAPPHHHDDHHDHDHHHQFQSWIIGKYRNI